MRIPSIVRLAFLAALAVAAASPARADVCAETEATLRSELALRFSGPDDPRALERRDRLSTLFAATSANCAAALYERLGERPTGDELSELFHGALATATRARLRTWLHDNFAAYDRLDAAIEENVSGAAEREHLQCWVQKLRMGKDADPRVVPWKNICPADDQDCPAHPHPTDDELAALAAPADVEAAQPLGIFFFLDTAVDSVRIDHVDSALDALREARREAEKTSRRFAAGDLPARYAVLGEWLAAKESDPQSALYCPRPMP